MVGDGFALTFNLAGFSQLVKYVMPISKFETSRHGDKQKDSSMWLGRGCAVEKPSNELRHGRGAPRQGEVRGMQPVNG